MKADNQRETEGLQESVEGTSGVEITVFHHTISVSRQILSEFAPSPTKDVT